MASTTTTTTTTTTTSQLSCFSAVHRRRSRTFFSPPCRPQSFGNVTSVEGNFGKRGNGFGLSHGLNYRRIGVEKTERSFASLNGEEDEDQDGDEEKLEKEITSEQKRSAKIHDFCFGIPFGGLVLSGGVIGFAFSRNVGTLGSGVLYGGALLALSTFSLKIWRQGKSCLPYILGQGVLAAALLWKNLQTYSLTKKLFPTGFYAAISAAMLCFYSYVLLSGGNPPPKKLKSSASVAA